jgi:hypothetical protein
MQEQFISQQTPPVLAIRPHFDQPLTMVHAGLFTAVSCLVITVVAGTFFYILLSILGLGRFIAASYIYGLLFVGAIAVIPPLFFEMRKKAYERTAFLFYGDYLEFQYFQFYLSRRRGRIRYADIKDVSQHASALQEHRRLTTIDLYVPSMGYRGRGFSGVSMTDLPQRADYMSQIMRILEVAARNPAPAPAPVMPAAAPDGNRLPL